MNHKEKNLEKIKLMPLYFMASVFPLITYGKIGRSPYADYIWGDSKGVAFDFFAYGKAVTLLVIVAFCMLILGIRRAKGIHFRPLPSYFYLLFLALWCVFLSALFSKDHALSLWPGNNGHETAFIIAAYLLLFLYTYQVIQSEEEVIRICKAFVPGLCIVLFWGIWECMGISVVEQDFWQRIFLGKYYQKFAGEMVGVHTGRVCATFENPDLTGTYLSILLPIIFMLLHRAEKKRKPGLVLLPVLLVLETIRTGYRGVFLATAVVLFGAFLIWLRRKDSGHLPKSSLFWGVITGAFLLLGLVDVFLNMGLLSGVTDGKTPLALSDIALQDNHVFLITEDRTAVITFTDDTYKIEVEENGIKKDVTDAYDIDEETLFYKGFEDVSIGIIKEDDWIDENLYITDGACKWSFCLENGAFVYRNAMGKRDVLAKAKTFLDPSYDYIGSGRIYVWSRAIPLLGKYIWRGSGACTAAAVFPQSDYMAKAKTFGRNNLIVSELDNSYLTMWIEHGLFMLLTMVIFGCIFIKDTLSVCGKEKENVKNALFLSLLLFLVNGLFISYSVSVTPIVVLIAGMLAGLRGNEAMKEQGSY